MKNTYSRAFTLIELLVVIAIIGILTGIIVTNLSQSRAKARDAKRISDIGQIQLALELFYDRCKEYPSANPGGVVNIGSSCNSGAVLLTNYISQIPKDPDGTDYGYSALVVDGKLVDYVLHANLEGNNEVVKDGLDNSSISGSTWTSPVPGTFGCSNLATSKEYCIAPR